MTFIPDKDFYLRVLEGVVPEYYIVNKWGRNGSVGTSLEPIISAPLAGAFWTPTTASTVRIKAGGNANDTSAGTGARSVVIQGLDENYALAEETIVTAGASASSSTTTTFIRVTRAFVSTTGTYRGANAAGITIENTAGTTDIIIIDLLGGIGQCQSLHCQYSSPSGSIAWLIYMEYRVDSTKLNNIGVKITDDISVVVAPFGATRTLIGHDSAVNNIIFNPRIPLLLNKPGITTPIDVWVEGAVNSTTSAISARMQLLVKTVS